MTPNGMPQLAQGLGFYLPYAFACDVKQLAYFFQSMVGFFADTETLAQNLFLAGSKIGKNRGDLL